MHSSSSSVAEFGLSFDRPAGHRRCRRSRSAPRGALPSGTTDYTFGKDTNYHCEVCEKVFLEKRAQRCIGLDGA